MACTFLRRCLLPRMLCLTHSWVPSSLGAGARVGQGSGIMLFLSSPLCRSEGRSQAMFGSHPHTCEPLSKHDSLNTSTQTCTQARKDPLFSVRQTLMFSCSRRNYFCRFFLCFLTSPLGLFDAITLNTTGVLSGVIFFSPSVLDQDQLSWDFKCLRLQDLPAYKDCSSGVKFLKHIHISYDKESF